MQSTARLTCLPYELILFPLSDIDQIGKTHPALIVGLFQAWTQPVPLVESFCASLGAMKSCIGHAEYSFLQHVCKAHPPHSP